MLKGVKWTQEFIIAQNVINLPNITREHVLYARKVLQEVEKRMHAIVVALYAKMEKNADMNTLFANADLLTRACLLTSFKR